MMGATLHVRLAAELGINDTVRTPSGRTARVLGHHAGRVSLQYVEKDGFEFPDDEVLLNAELLVLVSRAPLGELPKGFFAGERR